MEPHEQQAICIADGDSFRRFTVRHIELVPKNKDFAL